MSKTPIFGGRYHTDEAGNVVPMPEQETDEHKALHAAKKPEPVVAVKAKAHKTGETK